MINRNSLRAAEQRRSTPGRPTPGRRQPTRGADEALSDARFPFQANPALRQQVLKEFVARASRHSPEAAKAVAAEIGRPSFEQSYATAVRSHGLSPNDAADVMAVYLITGWEIVNGTDSNDTALRAVRRQVAGQMAGSAAMRDPTARARFAEELKIITLLFGSSVENARREGNRAQFAAGVAAHYRQALGRDLRAMRLTAQGFSGG
ncbi:hypothetical protein ETR14_06130 [Sphingosinicella sp. BN140058]|nr:DUF6683 family protein [Sphingosinicella sp. BN140058]QAY76153.1 hypothetical protein ETR14_06130 [Sphingosinicella sp. BN140058]